MGKWTTIKVPVELDETLKKVLDNPQIRELGITSKGGLAVYCIRFALTDYFKETRGMFEN